MSHAFLCSQMYLRSGNTEILTSVRYPASLETSETKFPAFAGTSISSMMIRNMIMMHIDYRLTFTLKVKGTLQVKDTPYFAF